MESNNLPKLIDTTELVKGIIIVLSYLLMTAILMIPFSFLVSFKIINETLANIGIYLSLAIIYSLIYRKTLITDFKKLKENYKNILKISAIYWLIGFIIMFFSSLVITHFHIESNLNQATNMEMLKNMPVAEILCACLFAPITEELIFRVGFKNISSNKHIYAFISGLLFAFLHVISSLSDSSSLIMLIYLIPYGALGVAFGYAYRKTDNIYGTITMHILHNILSILQLVLIGCLL